MERLARRVSSWRTDTTSSGSAWTPSAIRLLEALWRAGDAPGRCGREDPPDRSPGTSARWRLGLAEAGHDVTGLDTFFYDGCDLWDDRQALPVLELDVRDVRPGDLEEFDAIVHLAALSNDPLGAFGP